MTTTTPERAAPGYLRTIIGLGALVALGPLTVDMYLPALPAIVGSLHTTEPMIQLTLTGSLIGLGFGQLVVGPLSDTLGRRRPMIAGIALHIAASVLSMLAGNIAVLGVLRVAQGLGAAAATVVAMAVVRDLFDGRAAANAMSRLMLVMGAAPILAPSLGSAVLLAGSWRWVFAALAVIGLGVLAVATATTTETLPAERRRPTGMRGNLRTYGSILGDTRFLRFALVTGLCFGAMFSYVSGSSFVFQEQFDLRQQQFGVLFGLSAVALIAGAQLNPPLLARYSQQRVAGAALLWIVLVGIVLTALQVTAAGGMLGFYLPVLGILAAGSLVIPNATALALSRHGEAAGTAAAVVGAIQFGIGSLLAPAVGLLGNDGIAVAVAMTSAAALAAATLGSLRRPEPRPAEAEPIPVGIGGARVPS